MGLDRMGLGSAIQGSRRTFITTRQQVQPYRRATEGYETSWD
ncbi:hypothetical protein [Hydrocarboniclastica marina]|nr:hypothetical protein [Hydrocarboniclastica marina]